MDKYISSAHIIRFTLYFVFFHFFFSSSFPYQPFSSRFSYCSFYWRTDKTVLHNWVHCDVSRFYDFVRSIRMIKLILIKMELNETKAYEFIWIDVIPTTLCRTIDQTSRKDRSGMETRIKLNNNKCYFQFQFIGCNWINRSFILVKSLAIGSEGETENSKIQMPHGTEKIDRSKKLKERKTIKCLRIRKNNTQNNSFI